MKSDILMINRRPTILFAYDDSKGTAIATNLGRPAPSLALQQVAHKRSNPYSHITLITLYLISQ